MVLVVKNLPANAGELREAGLIPGSGGSLEESMATHSITLAWRILWTEEPGGLQSTGSQSIGHGCATNFFSITLAAKILYPHFTEEETA